VHERLSPAMREILTSCASAGGAVLCSELVAQRVRRGDAQSVVRASLSRTLRRLWRLGLVELSDGFRTATGGRDQALEQLQRVRRDPAGAYAAYQRRIGRLAAFTAARRGRAIPPVRDPYGSPESFLDAAERETHRFPRLRVLRVALTAAGVANSRDVATVNRNGHDGPGPAA
jgi:hypothetical protein